MIKAVIFDYFGLFTKPGTFDALMRQYAKEHNLDLNNLVHVRRELWQKAIVEEITEEKFWRGILDEFHIDLPLEVIRREWYTGFDPVRETFNLAERVKKKYRVALLTNTVRDWFTYWREKYCLDDLFDIIVTSFDEKVRKNNPEIYIKALKKLRVRPEECVFIDDKEKNTKTADMLGMKTIIFTSPEQCESELKKLGLDF